MNYYAAFTLLCFVIYLFLGCRALFLNPAGRANRSYFYLCLSFAVWAFGSTFVTLSGSSEDAAFWFKISSLGFITFPLFGIMLFHALLGRITKMSVVLVNAVFGTITLIFLYISLSQSLFTTGFVKMSFGWQKTGSFASPVDYLFLFYYIASLTSWIAFYIISTIKHGNEKEKKMMYTIAGSSMVSLLCSTVTNTILPGLGLNIPTLGPVFVIFWAFGSWFAMRYYGFMHLMINSVAEEALAVVKDAVFITDRNKYIKYLNASAVKLLGYSEEELIGRPIYEVFEDGVESYIRNLHPEITGNALIVNKQMNLLDKRLHSVPVNFSLSPLKDRTNITLGFVAVAHDVRNIIERHEEELAKNDELGRAYVELKEKQDKLRSVHSATVKEELEMLKLKKEINKLLKKEKYSAGGPA